MDYTDRGYITDFTDYTDDLIMVVWSSEGKKGLWIGGKKFPDVEISFAPFGTAISLNF
jgi:hypothetical protein